MTDDVYKLKFVFRNFLDIPIDTAIMHEGDRLSLDMGEFSFHFNLAREEGLPVMYVYFRQDATKADEAPTTFEEYILWRAGLNPKAEDEPEMTYLDVRQRIDAFLMEGRLQEASEEYPDWKFRFTTVAPARTYVMPMSDDHRKVAAAWELFVAWLEEGTDAT